MRDPDRDYGRLRDIIQAAWQTALVDVPILKKQVEAIVNSLSNN